MRLPETQPGDIPRCCLYALTVWCVLVWCCVRHIDAPDPRPVLPPAKPDAAARREHAKQLRAYRKQHPDMDADWTPRHLVQPGERL